MNKPRQYDSPTLKRIAERIPKELSDQNDRRMGLAVKIIEIIHCQRCTKSLYEINE